MIFADHIRNFKTEPLKVALKLKSSPSLSPPSRRLFAHDQGSFITHQETMLIFHSGDGSVVACFMSEKLSYKTEFQRAPFLSGGLGERRAFWSTIRDFSVVRRKCSARLCGRSFKFCTTLERKARTRHAISKLAIIVVNCYLENNSSGFFPHFPVSFRLWDAAVR